jgi:hypothetical protein
MSPDKRRFTRIPFDAPARLVSTHIAHVLDVSLKGALIAKPADWTATPGQALTLQIPLGEGDAMIRMETRVAHVEPDRVGLHCEHIDLDSISHLKRLVELNLGDEELLHRELAALGK